MANSRNLWTQKILGNAKNPRSRKQISFAKNVVPEPEKIFGKREAFVGFVLGIDPSLRGSGFAVVEFSRERSPKLHFSKTLKLKPELSFAACLGEIYKLCSDCCYEFPVRHVALEETIYVNNFKIAQILGAARGAAIAAATVLEKEVFEYPPLRIKQAVVGFGRATKSQVAGMTKQILCLEKSLPFDESDAAAAAICHAFSFKI